MADSVKLSISGQFEAVPQKTFVFDYKGSAFNDLLSDLPSTNLWSAFVALDVLMEPGKPAPAYGGYGLLLTLLVSAIKDWVDPMCNPSSCDPMACPNGCNSATKLTLPGDHKQDLLYGNPFSFGQEIAGVTLEVRSDVTALLPADTTTERLQGRISVAASAAGLTGALIAPEIGLPRNVKINGQAAPVDKVTAGVGDAPEIAFDAPSVGAANYYNVRIIDLDDVKDANGGVIRRNRLIAVFTLPGTSLKAPAGLLQPGKHYYVQVQAMADAKDLAAPYREATKTAQGTTFSGIITP
jgi:hypothetical protein